MNGESGIAKVGCGIQKKEVTSHEFGVITGSDITSGSTSTANNFWLDGWLERKKTLKTICCRTAVKQNSRFKRAEKISKH